MQITEARELLVRQLGQLRRLRARVAELELAAREPLAMVGAALRFPCGISDLESYWEFLLGERNGSTAIPPDRPGLRAVHQPGRAGPGRSYVGRAAFLDDVAAFDAGFFGISSREAATCDPQQRLLLETTWEAMERAGIAVERRHRLPVGVFIGMMSSDYAERPVSGTPEPGPLTLVGGGHALAAGRISYTFGFGGPALSVDTACSSSLTALHLAAQSLRRNECRYALVGGANLIFSGGTMVALCQSGALASDGRCKSFLDSADGYGRGEGVGVVVLMRLSDAEREGRPIMAVLRGSAVNHDGASSGLTVPNGRAQQEVIRAALADSGLTADRVGYVEAHGTGTRVGDPIEIRSIDTVLGSGAPQRRTPLQVGTVKARLGHLEGAAGIAGVIKAALMVREGQVPQSISVADGPLNALVDWEGLDVEVPRGTRPWLPGPAARVAAVSSFGMSGTNAHALLEEYRPPASQSGHTRWPELLTVSAKSLPALRDSIAAIHGFLADLDTESVAAACHTLRAGRVAHAYRHAVVADSIADLRTALIAATDIAPPSGHLGVVSIALSDNDNRLRSMIEALAPRFPLLFAGTTPDREPAQRLIAACAALGLTVDPTGRPTDPAVVARASWAEHTVELTNQDPVREFLALVAELFRSGIDISLAALAAPGTAILPTVPTYPFQRKPYWLDESPRPTAPADRVVPPDARTRSFDSITESIFAELAAALHADAPVDRSASFLDVGGDSFTAMQLTITLESRYRVEFAADEIDLAAPLSVMVEALAATVTNGSPASGGSQPSTP
ncbi:beta-ketoacyl synthase N-terminal-like domain-containing protein [Nocardia sp. NBC_00511]|uniref:beta-ketoacyl synthase N-terminal-like domain-containing protein n=1 Tax=Nocardia sp. NBC_00511 TaxID=2903591 RepID=UPI0030E3358C